MSKKLMKKRNSNGLKSHEGIEFLAVLQKCRTLLPINMNLI